MCTMISILSLFIFCIGCSVETGGVAPGGVSKASYAIPKSCASPHTFTVDYGQQVGAATTARAVWSDVKYIPSGIVAAPALATGNVVSYSSSLGSAWVDSGAQALKYSYWTNGKFVTETVYGDAVADITYVRLGYLSNAPNTGIPLIFFSNGAANNGQIMIAVRSTASFTAQATWKVKAIDTNAGSTNRALELSISPSDQVGLVYQGVTSPTANNIRFIYCSSNCNDPAQYVPQDTTGTSRIDSGANAAQIHLGIGWCQMSSGIYNPAVVYGSSATTFQFALCNTGVAGNVLTSCASNAGWTRTAATLPVTGASGTTSDLYLDPSILGDVPKIVVKDVGGAKMKTFSTTVGCNSVVGGTTYTAAGASAIVGSGIANYASSWLKILKAPDYVTAANERFYLVANDGITAVKWSGTTTNSFNGAWFANAASPIQTVTLNAVGLTNLGADLNTTTHQLVSSYGVAAGTFNVTLGVLDNFVSPGDPGSAANVYYQLPIDDSGHMQLNATQFNNIALASTSTARPGIAWVDFSSGLATTGKLKYSLRTGSSSTDQWKVIAVPGAFGASSPQYPSIAFDNNDQPWIGYYDAQGAGAGRFILTTNTAIDGSGQWTSYMFPVVTAGHGVPAGQPAANMPVVAMSYVGGVATPVMIIIDNGTTPAVKAAGLNPVTGAWSAVSTIESLAAQGAAFLSVDWSQTSNLITVAYQNLKTANVRVKYSASTDGGLTWPVNSSAAFPVSGIAQGEGTTVKINPQTGNPSIAYYDRANARLYLAQCTANCTGTGVPTFSGTGTGVLNGVGIAGLAGAGNANLLTAGLTFSGPGDAYVLYNSGQLDVGALRMVDNIGGVMPSNLPETIVSGANGAFSNAAATNGGIPWGQRVTRMINGVLATAYISPGNLLNITTCGD